MPNKIFISNKLKELIAFLKKELTSPVTILEPNDYERPIPKRNDNLKPINSRPNGGFVAYLNQFHPHHRSDYSFQERSK